MPMRDGMVGSNDASKPCVSACRHVTGGPRDALGNPLLRATGGARMSRITSTILVLMLLMNGTVTVMATSGLTEDLGVQVAPGISDQMDQVVTEMQNGFSPNIGIIESFISLALAGLNIFTILVTGLWALPTAMINIFGGSSLVATIVTVLFAPAYMLATLEMVYMASGRDMI